MDLLIPSAGLPESNGLRLRLNDDRLQAKCAWYGQPRFGLLEQLSSQTEPSKPWGHHQSIDRSSPSIPGRDTRPDDRTTFYGDDQRRGIVHDKQAEALHVVRVSGFGPSLGPELQD